MSRWMLWALLFIGSAACAAQDVDVGCQHLRVVLDPRITPAIVDEDWGSGAAHEAVAAAVELVGCDGRALARFPLEAPLARIDPLPVKGAPHPTFLVSTDLTADAGSYNGPLTILLQIVNDRLDVATVAGAHGGSEPIHLALTGKAAWQRLSTSTSDQFLQVSSHPARTGFVTDYRRFYVARSRWREKVRVRAGPWESDGEFPAADRFP